MRFKFCGDMEPPEWVLGEIATLSKIVRFIQTAVRMKLAGASIAKQI